MGVASRVRFGGASVLRLVVLGLEFLAGGGDFVDVDDINATAGNPITLGPNSVTGSNTPGWFVAGAVPALGALGLALVAASLLWSGRRALATRRGSLATR